MKSAENVGFAGYAGHPNDRVARALARHSGDPVRARLTELLVQALDVVGGDRAAVVKLPPKGDAVIPHTVVDAVSDRPRRHFEAPPLTAAGNQGPGKVADYPFLEPAPALPPPPRSIAAVMLGSDGTDTWFMQVDGGEPRAPLNEAAEERVSTTAREAWAHILRTEPEKEGFRGWKILSDLDKGETDVLERARISLRFQIGRLLERDVSLGFTHDAAGVASEVEILRERLHVLSDDNGERSAFERVLEGIGARDLEDLADGCVEAARALERGGDLPAAQEFTGMGYKAGMAAARATVCAEALRLLARLRRRLGEWEAALHAAKAAGAIGHAYEDPATIGYSLLAEGAVHAEMGDQDRAGETLERALAVAHEHGNDEILARAHTDLMVVETNRGRRFHAAIHGWRAVGLLSPGDDRDLALYGLATVCLDVGDLDSAEDAYVLVRVETSVDLLRVASTESLAHIAALRGDAEGFRRWASLVDEMGWRKAGNEIRVNVELLRGQSIRALGDTAAGDALIHTALREAEAAGMGKVADQARDALSVTPKARAKSSAPAIVDLGEVRNGLREMRERATMGSHR